MESTLDNLISAENSQKYPNNHVNEKGTYI